MWTTVPPTGFAFQTPIGIGGGPLSTPAFGSSNINSLAGGIPNGVQSLPAPPSLPTSAYGYGPGMIAISPQSLTGGIRRRAVPTFEPVSTVAIVNRPAARMDSRSAIRATVTGTRLHHPKLL